MDALAAMMAPDFAQVGIATTSIRGRVIAESFLGSLIAIWRWWADHPDIPRNDIHDAFYDLLWHGLEGLNPSQPD
jgi:hypothetical protein